MKISIGILALACAAPVAAQPADPCGDLPVGTWSQASRGQELVLLPKVKLISNVGVSMGTSLSGSVGYSSMMRSAIVIPAAGSVNAAVRIEPDRLAELVCAQWVHITRD